MQYEKSHYMDISFFGFLTNIRIYFYESVEINKSYFFFKFSCQRLIHEIIC